MSHRVEPPTAENPFSTRHVRPGALSFLFARGDSTAALVEQLQRNGWRGQITGPHGAGKSTLLATLVPELQRAGRQPVALSRALL